MATVGEIFKKVIDDLFTVSTPWSFSSSGGGSASALVFGVSGGVLYLKNDSTKEEKKLWYGAGGASAGPLPGGGSFHARHVLERCGTYPWAQRRSAHFR